MKGALLNPLNISFKAMQVEFYECNECKLSFNEKGNIHYMNNS